MRHGVFITFEGGDGTGKSTQLGALDLALSQFGYETLRVREPGGTRIGEAIREMLLAPDSNMNARSELLLYEAARSQITSDVIVPAMREGKVVLCDRFSDSTVAYQGYGRGIDVDLIVRLNEFATGGLMPDRTILLDLDTQSALERATNEGADRLELEGDEFHERVHRGFLELARHDDRIRVVRTSPHRAQTAFAIYHELSDLFPEVGEDAYRALIDSDHPRFFKGHED